MIVSRALPGHEAGVGARRVGRGQADERLERDALGVDARQDLQPLADRGGLEGGGDRRERVGAVALRLGRVGDERRRTDEDAVDVVGIEDRELDDDVAAGRRVAGDVADRVGAGAHQGELIEAVGQRVCVWNVICSRPLPPVPPLAVASW